MAKWHESIKKIKVLVVIRTTLSVDNSLFFFFALKLTKKSINIRNIFTALYSVIRIAFSSFYHPHIVIRHFSIHIFPFAFYHPHFIVRILSSAFYRPHFIIRILLSAFYHPHFIIRILSSTFFHPPSAIRSEVYRDPRSVTDGGHFCHLWLLILKTIWHSIGDTS